MLNPRIKINPIRLHPANVCFRAAVACVGGMYEKLGRMVGRSYEETISLLIKALKNAEVTTLSFLFKFFIFESHCVVTLFHNRRC